MLLRREGLYSLLPNFIINRRDRCRNWLLSTATIVTTLAAAAKIHETFYPDLATRKKHLKRIGNWLLNIAAFGTQIWAISGEIRHPMPTTSAQLLGTVLKVSFSVSMLLFLIQLQCLDYIVGRLLRLMNRHADNTEHIIDNAGRMANSTGQIIEVLKNHEKAIVILSASHALEPQTRAELTRLLD